MRQHYTLKVSSSDPNSLLLAYQRAFTIMPQKVSPLDKVNQTFTVSDMTDGPQFGPGRNVFSAWCKRNDALITEKISEDFNEKLVAAK